MGAIQRIMSNDVACRHVALDFARPREQRLLFPRIEPDVLPGTPEADEAIREAVAYLHQRILGLDDPPESPDVRRTAELFAGVVAEAQQQEGLDRREVVVLPSGRSGVRRPALHYPGLAGRGDLFIAEAGVSLRIASAWPVGVPDQGELKSEVNPIRPSRQIARR
jgi:hypothetical protein